MAGWTFSSLLFRRPQANLRGIPRLLESEGYNLDLFVDQRHQKVLSKLAGGGSRQGHRIDVDVVLKPGPGGVVLGYIYALEAGQLEPRHAEVFLSALPGVPQVKCRGRIFGGWRAPKQALGPFGVSLKAAWPPGIPLRP